MQMAIPCATCDRLWPRFGKRPQPEPEPGVLSFQQESWLSAGGVLTAKFAAAQMGAVRSAIINGAYVDNGCQLR